MPIQPSFEYAESAVLFIQHCCMFVFFCIPSECPSLFIVKFVAGLAAKCPVKEKCWSRKEGFNWTEKDGVVHPWEYSYVCGLWSYHFLKVTSPIQIEFHPGVVDHAQAIVPQDQGHRDSVMVAVVRNSTCDEILDSPLHLTCFFFVVPVRSVGLVSPLVRRRLFCCAAAVRSFQHYLPCGIRHWPRDKETCCTVLAFSIWLEKTHTKDVSAEVIQWTCSTQRTESMQLLNPVDLKWVWHQKRKSSEIQLAKPHGLCKGVSERETNRATPRS